MTRLRGSRKLFTARPFQNDGHSLYMTEGSTVAYRKNKLLRRGTFLKSTTSEFDFGTSVPKTQRVASADDPDVSIPYTIPAGDLPTPGNAKLFTFDIRKHGHDLENESTNYATVTIEVDENGDEVTDTIQGTHTLLNSTIKAGGVAIVRFRYHPSGTGINPLLFRVTRVTGPAGAIDQTVNYLSGTFLYEITLTGLLDTSAYGLKLDAENGASITTLESSFVLQADATGPTVLTNGSVEAI